MASSCAGPATDDLVRPTKDGLWCEKGGFHIDPDRAVPLAVITHAHADHAARGCERYVASPATAALLRDRISKGIDVTELPFGEAFSIGGASISLHPAGHVLGSSQVRVEAKGEPVWCISGDYKVERDQTAEPFEAVPCDVFVTESTFGLPVFRWPDSAGVAQEMRDWWGENAKAGLTSVLLAYSLGKAQRVLASLVSEGQAPPGLIGLHGAAVKLTQTYHSLGVGFPDYVPANEAHAAALRGTGLIIAPPSQAGSPWLRKFVGPEGIRTAMASGWMAMRGRRRWQSLDTGFVVSDHADWPGLLEAIRATGATRIGVTHGYTEHFARYLREELGMNAFSLPTRWGEAGSD